jgi:hypothetical protein
MAARLGIRTADAFPADAQDLLKSIPVLAYIPEADRTEIISKLPALHAPKPAAQQSKGAKSANREESNLPRFGLRDARPEDIPDMVDVDMRSFSRVYEDYRRDPDAHRADLIEKYRQRYEKLGGSWMPVVTKRNEQGEDKVVGLIVGCPTNKGPEDFVSWEKTTGDGTLEGLYDADGRNIYVVTLSVDPSIRGERAQDQLYTRLMGRFIREKMDTAFFESRMPGLYVWVRRECRVTGRDFDALTDADKMEYALRYAALTKEVNGKKVPHDSLLRLYSADFGCNLERVVPNAYSDKPSMDFGALYTFKNPVPRKLRRTPIGTVVGKALEITARSTKTTRKMMKLLGKILG